MKKFEITDTKNMTVQEATKAISDNYHDSLTYNGIEFFDSIYMNLIMELASKVLNPTNEADGQESYLGYLSDEDTFISGWDTWESECYYDHDDESVHYSSTPEFEGNLVYIKIIDGKAVVVKIGGCAGDMMYGQNSTLEKVRTKHKNLVDIRLD